MKFSDASALSCSSRSHPARGAWIEIPCPVKDTSATRSHPARGAWIEMLLADGGKERLLVAPRKGCVD